MLWLAGLMGLIAVGAVGAVSFIDTSEAMDEEVDTARSPAERIDMLRGTELDADDVDEDDPAQTALGGAIGQSVLNDIRMDGETMADADTETDLSRLEAASEPATVIDDFAPKEDALLFVWDDATPDSEAPEIALTPDPDNPGQLQVKMGSELMAQVSGAEALTDLEIAIIPYSSAEALDLVRA